MNEHVGTPASAIGISLSVDVAKGRNLVFQTYVERDSNLAWINQLLDKLNAAGDRQTSIYSLADWEKQLASDEFSYQDTTTKMMMIDEREKEKAVSWANSGRKGDFKRTPQDQTHYDQLVENLKRLKMTIDKEKDIIADLKKKIGAIAA